MKFKIIIHMNFNRVIVILKKKSISLIDILVANKKSIIRKAIIDSSKSIIWQWLVSIYLFINVNFSIC